MMLSEAVHRFSPQFMVPLFQYTLMLLASLKDVLNQMAQFVFQTFIFPTAEFIYNVTVRVLRIQKYVPTSVRNLFNKGIKSELKENEDYCGSSFDGSSNTSVSSDAANNNDNNNDNNNNKFNFDNEVNNVNDDYHSNQFRQQFMETASEYLIQARELKSGIQEKVEGSLQNIKDMTPKNLREMGQYSFDKYDHYKQEYFQYYKDLVVEGVKNPSNVIEAGKDYARQKCDLLLDLRVEVENWVDYAKSLVSKVIEYVRQSFYEIRSGKFDHWQLVWDVCEFARKGVISVSEYFGSDSLVSRALDKLNVLGLLVKVKSYAKGPEIIHQKQY